MNLKTAAEITALSTSGQREYAKEIGVKRAADDTKATLAAKLLNRTLEIEKAQRTEREEIAAIKARAKMRVMVETPARAAAKPITRTGKICNVCNTRKAGNDAGVQDMCQECADEGGWENTHNDNDHAGIRAKVAKGEELSEHEAAELKSGWMTGCWICFPEKNRASADFVPRKGSSKEGMKVTAKGDKITLVVETLRKMGAIVRTDTTKNGYTGLVASLETAVGTYQIEAGWNGRAFFYPASSWNGKKFRNVSELFRLLGVEA